MLSLAGFPFVSLLLASAPLVAANPITSHAQLTPRQSTLSCPASNGTTFTSSAGTAFVVECNTDRQGNDMGLTYASGLDSCINSCSTTNGCVDVSWVVSNGFCYLKNTLSTPQPNSGVYGARLVAAPLPSAAPTAISCPASNGQSFVANGQTFTLECFLDHTGGDTGLTYQSTYAACVSNCAATPGCLAASWVASNGFCYVKNALNPANTNSGVWGARLGAATTSTSTSQPPASSTSTSTSISTSRSTSAPTSASTSTSTSAPTSTSTSTSLSTSTSISSATSVSTSTSTTTSSTATPTVIGTSGSLTCPGSHGSRYIDASGTNFIIECYTDRQGADIHNQYANNLTACMSACANYPGCVDATYVVSQTQCWMKGHLQIPVNGNTDLVNARVVSPASLSPNPTVYSTPQYPGYAGIKYWFAFGDSYSADSFDFNGVQPGPGNPTGNPGSPYATTASGPNYLIYLANVNSSSPIYLYDMANIGAIVDPTAFGYGPQLAHPQIQQVAYDWLETYVDNPNVPWTAQNSMFSQFFGINDCDDLYGLDANTQALYMAADLAAYRAQMELIYFEGGRNFLIINTTPTNRVPGWTQFYSASQQAALAQVISTWNAGLQTMISQLRAAHPDITIIFYDAWSLFTTILNNPTNSSYTASYPMLAGIKEIGNWCGSYGPGNPTNGNQYACDPSCSAGCVYNYFWTDYIHPTWPVHQVLAGEIRKLL